jgi:uncharacterized protein YbaR (Trm112 family)
MVRDLCCPVCNADIPLSGEEQVGEEVYCTYCNAPFTLTKKGSSDEFEVEEDF